MKNGPWDVSAQADAKELFILACDAGLVGVGKQGPQLGPELKADTHGNSQRKAKTLRQHHRQHG